jgi:hypothetical protein
MVKNIGIAELVEDECVHGLDTFLDGLIHLLPDEGTLQDQPEAADQKQLFFLLPLASGLLCVPHGSITYMADPGSQVSIGIPAQRACCAAFTQ